MEMLIGEQIRNARNKKGMTQQELAESVGVIRQTITEYELDNIKPSASVLLKIMSVLDIKNFEN